MAPGRPRPGAWFQGELKVSLPRETLTAQGDASAGALSLRPVAGLSGSLQVPPPNPQAKRGCLRAMLGNYLGDGGLGGWVQGLGGPPKDSENVHHRVKVVRLTGGSLGQ